MKNPITDEPLTSGDLISLNFIKNEEGKYIDPVTFKVLTPSTNIVCIRNSGNVYSRETIDELNIKAKNWADLVTGEKFSIKDLITLQVRYPSVVIRLFKIANTDAEQDPMNLSRTMPSKTKEPESKASSAVVTTSVKRPVPDSQSASMTSSKRAALPFNASTSTTGRAAQSLTSTAASPFTKSDRQILTDEEFLLKHRRVKESGYVQIRTNLGNLNVELNTIYTPKTVYNFLKLAEKGYYNGVKFHRNIRHFMVHTLHWIDSCDIVITLIL